METAVMDTSQLMYGVDKEVETVDIGFSSLKGKIKQTWDQHRIRNLEDKDLFC